MYLNWRLCVILVYILIPIAVSKLLESKQAKEYCLNKYKSEKEFTLEQLLGDWHPIYFWPKEFAAKDCIKVTFKEVAYSETAACKDNIPEGEKVIQSTYTINGKTVKNFVYGAGGVKHFSTDFGRENECNILDGVLFDLGNGYILNIICPYEFSTLMARNVTSSSELQSVISSIDLLKDKEGSSSCV